LVLQASVLGKGKEVFLLDMGEPVKIRDLAFDLIRLSGLEPERDIKIKYSGIRPGEKLYEELFDSSETYQTTRHKKIFIVKSQMEIDSKILNKEVGELRALGKKLEYKLAKEKIKEILHHYKSYSPAPQHSNHKKAEIPHSVKTDLIIN
jgi:FlaA1/EpsC-like NDP-sugar epimerase